MKYKKAKVKQHCWIVQLCPTIISHNSQQGRPMSRLILRK